MKVDMWLARILMAATPKAVVAVVSEASKLNEKEEALGCVTLSTPITVKLQSESMVPADCVLACSTYKMALISHEAESLSLNCACVMKLSNNAVNSTECKTACPGADSPFCGGFDRSVQKPAWSVYNVPGVFELADLSPRDNRTCAGIYYQCGGVEWTGVDCCISGAFCTELNPYYWQCIALTESTVSATPTNLNEKAGLTTPLVTQVSPLISNSTTGGSPLPTETPVIVGASVGTIVFLAAGFLVVASVYRRRIHQTIEDGTVDCPSGPNSAVEFDGYLKLNGSNIILAGVNSKRNSMNDHAFDFEDSGPRSSVAVLQQQQLQQHQKQQQQQQKAQNSIITRLQTRISKTEVANTSPQKRMPRIPLFESRTNKTTAEDSENHKNGHEKNSNNQIEDEQDPVAIRYRPPVTIGQNVMLGAMRGNFIPDKSAHCDNILSKETAKSTPETPTTTKSRTRAALLSSPIDYEATNSENTKSTMMSSFLSYDLLIGGKNPTNTHASSLYMETIIRNDRIEFNNDDDEDV
ncbi:hypothetical protein HK100_010109 [Physocladia obscura]|uniref:Carbohydrate-binding module family 1 protein n=1 Tax=Physocladia obscura TaxID=109957 RepID=A0AAD5T5D6_9FUNG|nr:hypothetical protein HK100_010109 [Physocladia obscura]